MNKTLKKTLSIILTILMIVSSVPLAFAADGHTHALSADGETIEFTELPADATRIVTAGSYYLTQDIEITDNFFINTDGTVNLCLNGHSITAVEENDYQTVVLLYGGTLNLCDCQGGGRITSAEGLTRNGVKVSYGTEFNMYGGEISGNSYGNSYGDGAVYIDNGSFTMYDGEIKNNTNTSTYGYSGNVYVDSGTFTMKGGKISENSAENAVGGVYVLNGTFIMDGGEISDNSGFSGGVAVDRSEFVMNGGIIKNNTAQRGGGIYLGDDTHFTMNGGEISGNTAEQGGGVYADYDSTSINLKKGVITGNTAQYAGGIGSMYGNSSLEISGADVQVYGNTSLEIYYNHNILCAMPITVSATLDSEKTKIYVETGADTVFAKPDGINLTTLKGMECCFIFESGRYIANCNTDGELKAIVWSSSIYEKNGDLVVDVSVDSGVTYQWYEADGETLTKISGETSDIITADKLVVGKTYTCRIYLDGEEVETLTIKYPYAITHQPTAEEPYVELNIDTDASYQWYTVEGDGYEVTNENAFGDWPNIGFPIGSTVYKDGKWIADDSMGIQYYFMVELEAGDTINFEFASEVEQIIFALDGNADEGIAVGGTECSVTVEESGTYWLITPPVDYVCADVGNIAYNAIEGETAAVLNPTALGRYACEVTFADGTSAISEVFEVTKLHDCDFSGEWKYDADKHWKECECGKISEEAEHTYTDGICECGYECPHENITESVCDICGYVEKFSMRIYWGGDKYTDFTVPYGANLMEVITTAEKEGKLLSKGDEMRIVNDKTNGIYYITGAYSFRTGGYITNTDIMPANDIQVTQAQYTYGWVATWDEEDNVRWRYSAKSGTLNEGWHYIEEDYDDVDGGARYYLEPVTTYFGGTLIVRAEGITEIDGKHYYFDELGRFMESFTGIHKGYFFENGVEVVTKAVDNKDGTTHRIVCAEHENCGVVFMAEEEHNIVNDACGDGCGYEYDKPADPTPDTPDEPDVPDEPEQSEEPTDEACDHICHSKNALIKVLWKIISFFYRLFNIQQYCDCGVIHYDAPVFG